MRVAVLGVGLIGGSIGMAARRAGLGEVIGFDADRGALSRARERGALDEASGSVAEAVASAGCVFVAVPVGAVAGVAAEALAAAAEDCVVSDVGSTKRAVLEAVGDPRFVGGHPLAGAETSGIEHAREDLFRGATWYLTPVPSTSGVLLDRLYRLVRGLGAAPCAIEAEAHDRILASVSHLPHVLANLLVEGAAGTLGEESPWLPATGPSFRDATRVAGAPSSIWTDIYLSNADALGAAIDSALGRLEAVRRALRAGDGAWLEEWNEAAAAHRRRLLESGLAGGELIELRAAVPNRPGVLAQLALSLGRGGVNIVDMALHPAADMSEGVVAVWVAGADAAARVEALVGELGFPVARP